MADYNPCDGNKPELNRGHVWRTLQDDADLWKLKYGSEEVACNEPEEGSCCCGPSCKLCYYWYCVHCHPEGPQEDCSGPDEEDEQQS